MDIEDRSATCNARQEIRALEMTLTRVRLARRAEGMPDSPYLAGIHAAVRWLDADLPLDSLLGVTGDSQLLDI